MAHLLPAALRAWAVYADRQHNLLHNLKIHVMQLHSTLTPEKGANCPLIRVAKTMTRAFTVLQVLVLQPSPELVISDRHLATECLRITYTYAEPSTVNAAGNPSASGARSRQLKLRKVDGHSKTVVLLV